jgi:hypothetical protein
MVDQIYTKKRSGFLEAPGYLFVCLARRKITTGVVVGYDYAGGAVGYGIGEDFAWVDEAAGERTDGYGAFGDEAVCAIQREANKVFLLLISNVGQLLVCFFWLVDNLLLAICNVTLAELERCHDFGNFGSAQAGHLL